MPLSLAGDLVEVDLGWAVVELAVVGGAFEAVVVSAVSFDHPGVCSVSSRGVGSVGDSVGGFGECRGEWFSGKGPPGWGPGGGWRGSCGYRIGSRSRLQR